MKKYLLLTLFCAPFFLHAQEVPRLKKYPIRETGMAVYLPSEPDSFDLTFSEDKSEVYTTEITKGGWNYGVIAVKLAETLGLETSEEKEDFIITYLDFLKEQFEIKSSAGYGRGHTMEGYEQAAGVIDYWDDKDGNQYKVKSWTDGKVLAVLYIYGEEEYPWQSLMEMYLNGFRFPAE